MPEELSPREARKQRNREFNRTQILDTAEDLFSRYGYHETGLKDVVDHCEFSVGAIYTFFSSKEDLYDSVLNRHSVANMQALVEILQKDGNPVDLLSEVAEFQISFFREHPAWGRLITRTLSPGLQPQQTRSPVMKATDTTYRRVLDLEAQIIARGQEQGQVREGNPLALARIYANLVTSYHTIEFGDDDSSTDFSTEELVALIRHILGA